jgi:hypothetical protein
MWSLVSTFECSTSSIPICLDTIDPAGVSMSQVVYQTLNAARAQDTPLSHGEAIRPETLQVAHDVPWVFEVSDKTFKNSMLRDEAPARAHVVPH